MSETRLPGKTFLSQFHSLLHCIVTWRQVLWSKITWGFSWWGKRERKKNSLFYFKQVDKVTFCLQLLLSSFESFNQFLNSANFPVLFFSSKLKLQTLPDICLHLLHHYYKLQWFIILLALNYFQNLKNFIFIIFTKKVKTFLQNFFEHFQQERAE